MKSIKDVLKGKGKERYQQELFDRHKYVTQEFQDYGYRIALKLGAKRQVSLYIKLAKEKPRALLEQAFSFAIDYPNAKNKGKLFMWKLSELEKEMEAKKSS
jgi:hypothetical protein